mgnify:FL=1
MERHVRKKENSGGDCVAGRHMYPWDRRVWARNKMSKGQPVGNASVQEASAASGDIANTITGTGSLEADDSDTVKIPSGITIKEVKVESGDAVVQRGMCWLW